MTKVEAWIAYVLGGLFVLLFLAYVGSVILL